MARSLHTQALRSPQAVWWAVLVAVWFTLFPALGHALAFAGVDGAQRMEICTNQGTQILAPQQAHTEDGPVDDVPANGQPATAQPHCALCLHQVDRCAGLPPDAPSLMLAAAAHQALTQRQVYFYFDKTSLWSPPRGPPTRAGSLAY